MDDSLQEIDDIAVRDAKVLHSLIASLFERFGVTGLSIDRFKLERMRKNRFASVRR